MLIAERNVTLSMMVIMMTRQQSDHKIDVIGLKELKKKKKLKKKTKEKETKRYFFCQSFQVQLSFQKERVLDSHP